MKMALIIIGAYLTLGVMALGSFDILTGNIRRNLGSATADTQSRVSSSGSYIGLKTSRVLIMVVAWLFWPLVLIGAVAKGKEDNGTQK